VKGETDGRISKTWQGEGYYDRWSRKSSQEILEVTIILGS